MAIAMTSKGFPIVPIAGGGGGGGGGGSAPVLLFTDFYAGPTTGGENNKGAYLSLYGFNFGAFSDYGVKNHVTIGGVEVDNYRCLVNAMGAGSGGPGQGVFETWGLQCLTVQVGALGTPTAGVALKIDLTVNGTHPSNPTDGSGNYLSYATKYDGTAESLTFTPQPGAIIFVDRVNGNNANPGTIASPMKDLQTSTAFGGVFHAATAAGATDGMKPGTHVYDLGGTSNGVGFSGFFANIFRISGTLPTGATNQGPICYTRYPGPAGANAPVSVVLQGTIDGSGNGGGGFNGNDSARAQETNPYDGLQGWGRSIHISNVKIISSVNGARDGAPINLQSSSDDWRIVNCDLSWPWTSNASGITNAGGIAGNGNGVRILGNYIHNIQGVVAADQNHGTYLDGSVVCAKNCVIFLNCYNTITAGNGIQTFNSAASDTIQNIAVHNNWVENPNKHCLNVADNTASRIDFNNVCVSAGESCYNMNSNVVTTANGLKCYNNTFYGWARVVTSRAAWWNQALVGSGSTDTRNNIFAQSSGATGTYTFISDNGGTNAFSYCQWYDPNGVLTTKPSQDSTGAYGNPQFNNVATKDFTLQNTSPCINSGTTPLQARTTDFLLKGFSGTPDRGAYEHGASYP